MAYDFIPDHQHEGIYFIGWTERRETGRRGRAFYRPLVRPRWVFRRVGGRIRRFGPFRTLAEAESGTLGRPGLKSMCGLRVLSKCPQ